MKLTIEIDDELYAELSADFYVPVLRWRRFNSLCGTGEAICNIYPRKHARATPPFELVQDRGRELEKKLPQQRIIPSQSPTDATDTDYVLHGDGFKGDERTKIVKAAKLLHEQEGVVEIDENAEISDARDRGGDDGVYVEAWLWVPGEEIK